MRRQVLLIVCTLVLGVSRLHAQVEDKESLIETIIKAQAAHEDALRLASGSAIVNRTLTVKENPASSRPRVKDPKEGSETYLADFKFKPDHQRVTCYLLDPSTHSKGTLLTDRLDLPETFWRYIPGENRAYHTDRNTSAFERNLGTDFRYSAFDSVDGAAFPQILRNGLKNADHWEATTRDDGMLVIRCGAERTSSAPKWESECVLDPNANYCLIENTHTADWGAGELLNETYTITWEQKDGLWVPKKVLFQRDRKHSPNHSSGLLLSQKRCEVDIVAFTPNASIDDSVFSPSDIRLPAGTNVNDMIAQVAYTVKGSAEDQSLLKGLGSDISSDLSKLAPQDASVTNPGAQSSSDERLPAAAPGGLSTSAIWAISVFCAVCVIIAVVVALKLRARK